MATTTKGKKKRELSPLILTILGAIATGLLAIANSYMQGTQAHALSLIQGRHNHELEEDKLRHSLILKAINYPEQEDQQTALQFYVKVGILSDPEKKIANIRSEEIPPAPQPDDRSTRSNAYCPDVKSISECPDEGCGPSFDEKLNKKKNIRSDEQQSIMRTIGWIKALPNPTRFTKENTNRDELKTLGEGQKITVVAYALSARRGSLETTNCGLSSEKDTSHHIVLVDPSLQDSTLATSEGDSVTAKFTPRVRLDHPNFTRSKLNRLIDPSNHGAPHGRLLVRVTGLLLFDSAHFLGRSLKRHNNWEIHPILKMEYCPSGETCRGDNDANWENLDDE